MFNVQCSKYKWILPAALLLTIGSCHKVDENTVEFETLTTDKTITLSNEEQSPTCTVSLKLQNATEANGHRGEVINSTVIMQLFNMQDVSMQSAMEQFTENYIKHYKHTMLPLYNQDRADTTKRAWYEYHYVVSSDAHPGGKGTVTYIANVDYFEGGAHSVQQTTVFNFQAKSGRLLTLKDVFVEGSEQRLGQILLRALMEKTGLMSTGELKEKGYLTTGKMFAPQNFIIGDETITFIYNPSEIAPYAVGSTELVIPYTHIDKLLKNSFATLNALSLNDK